MTAREFFSNLHLVLTFAQDCKSKDLLERLKNGVWKLMRFHGW